MSIVGTMMSRAFLHHSCGYPHRACLLQGNVVTKAGAEPAAGVAAPGGANPVTGKGTAEGGSTLTGHAEPAGEPAK